MSPGTIGELWRLHNHAGVVMTCDVNAVGDGYRVRLRKSGIEELSEEHRSAQAAFERAENIRRQLLAEGWSGVFPRTP